MNPRHSPIFLKSLIWTIILGTLAASPLRADLNSDLAFTAFSNVDINALAGGQILQARGGLIEFQRGITTQSLYVIHATPAEVQKKLLTWNPANHPDLKVWIHNHLPPKPTTPADFASLSSLPNNSSVQYLVTATAKLDPSNPALQVSKKEAQQIESIRGQGSNNKALLVNFWSQILSGRANSFLSGYAATDSYAIDGNKIEPLSEIKSLLHSNSKVERQFQPLISQTPVYASTKMPPATLYYDCYDIEGGAGLGTGAIFQATSGTSIQSVDMEYFFCYGIYASVEMEQLWPITVNGAAATLVWRNDMVSTENVAYLHGTERMASGMIMLQEVKGGIEAFRSEFK